jgi:enamine deaminase RidA (YjgF/YER057c/UK114 family)
MNAEENLRRLGLSLPQAPRPLGAYVSAVEAGSLLFLSGMLPLENGIATIIGRVGDEVSVELGRTAAQQSVRNALAVARETAGLNRLAGVVRLSVHIACGPHFHEHALVADGASELLNQVFAGSKGHVRLVFGSTALSRGVPVELDLILLLT